MARIGNVTLDNAQGKAKDQLEGVKKMLGSTPNMFTALANSPAALGGYLSFSQALSGSSISGALREQIALATAGYNGCDYCASAHTMLGKNAGVGEDELRRNLAGESGDERTAAALAFVRAILEHRGRVSDEAFEAVRGAGFGDAEIAEIIATTALNVFTNYFNIAGNIKVDFPHVSAQPAGV